MSDYPLYTLAEWNRAADTIARAGLIAGPGMTTTRNGSGIVISAKPDPAEWQHPWSTSVAWDPEEGCFTARVLAGTVNGEDPLIPGAGEDGEDLPCSDDRAVLRLRAFRPIDGSGESVLEFFARLGVPKRAATESFNVSELGSVTVTDSGELSGGTRQLSAADIYVSVARAALRTSVTEVDGTGATGLVVDYSVGYDTSELDRLGTRARLMTTGKWSAPRVPTFMERFLGTYDEPKHDEELIATVYLLSTDRPADDYSTWTPYVKYGRAGFWNLEHAALNRMPDNRSTTLRIFTGLAAGLGDLVANQSLSGINELSDRVLTAVRNQSNAGRYWSA